MPSLENIFLHVTRRCNLRCKYCYFSAGEAEPGEMTASEYRQVWPSVVGAHPGKIIFTGGEPLLREDLLTLIRDLAESDPRHEILRCLNTNGHCVDRNMAKSLVGVADEVRISIDGMRERNDRQRGRGNFAAAVAAIRTFSDVGFEPKILVTVTQESAPDLEELCHFLLNDLGVTRININSFRPIGRGEGHPEWLPSVRHMDSVVDQFKASASTFLPIGQKISGGCGIGRSLNITPTGDVYPCHVFMGDRFLLGNIRRNSFTELQSSRVLAMLKLASRETFEIGDAERRSTRCLSDVLQNGVALGTTNGLIQIQTA